MGTLISMCLSRSLKLPIPVGTQTSTDNSHEACSLCFISGEDNWTACSRVNVISLLFNEISLRWYLLIKSLLSHKLLLFHDRCCFPFLSFLHAVVRNEWEGLLKCPALLRFVHRKQGQCDKIILFKILCSEAIGACVYLNFTSLAAVVHELYSYGLSTQTINLILLQILLRAWLGLCYLFGLKHKRSDFQRSVCVCACTALAKVTTEKKRTSDSRIESFPALSEIEI